MRAWKGFLLLCGVALVALGLYGARLTWRGFSTADQPSYLERTVARGARNLAILGIGPSYFLEVDAERQADGSAQTS